MQFFKVFISVFAFLMIAVSCTSGEVKECETIFDCPEGYMCDEYFQCVLINDKNDNNSSTDNETVPDENDSTVLPDNGQPDENEPVDNNVTPDENDEAVIPDEEEDDDFQHDEDVLDEDVAETEIEMDEDTAEAEMDEDITDEDFTDEDTNDEDTVIIPEFVIIGEGYNI